MDKERLKELKCEYMALYQNGYIKLPLLDDLLAIIDSALAEPSDVDVADAIKVMTEMLLFMDGTIPADAMSNYGDERQVYETAIAALRQYQKPTDGSTDVSTDSTRATGCEWCDKILTLFTNSGKYMPENQPPRNYCTNCGRKLVKHDG
jgi:hypothetical protein